MTVELVKFQDGAYGVRRTRGLLFKRYEFWDFTSTDYWWPLHSKFIRHCHVDDEESARNAVEMWTDNGEVVK